jgi:hypothetical protein
MLLQGTPNLTGGRFGAVILIEDNSIQARNNIIRLAKQSVDNQAGYPAIIIKSLKRTIFPSLFHILNIVLLAIFASLQRVPKSSRTSNN